MARSNDGGSFQNEFCPREPGQDRVYFPYNPAKAKPMGTGLTSEEYRESKRKLIQQQEESLKKAMVEKFGPDYWRAYLHILRPGNR